MLNKPRKVDNEPKVEGQCYSLDHGVREFVKSTPKCWLESVKESQSSNYPGDISVWSYTIKCDSEEIASSLAKLMRVVNL